MNDQLSDHPAAELIHEILAKSLAGRLQLQHDRIKVLVYFDKGELLYAASNAHALRLREYLLKAGVAEGALARYDDRGSDLELVKALCADHVLTAARAEQIQAKQVSDVVRLALSWDEGQWEFDIRSRLDGASMSSLDARPLLLDAGRRTPPKVVASRFANPAELISPNATLQSSSTSILDHLLPVEGFLLSRLDRPTPLKELLAVSGVGENEALVHLYSLALAGVVERTGWNYALGGPAVMRATPPPPEPARLPVAPVEEKVDEIAEAQNFLEQLSQAQTHYDVLDVSRESTATQMKLKYYDLARRYHPDRFRRAENTLVRRLESAFARVTQAYDTLCDDRLRAHYDAKLEARQRAQQLADSAPKPTTPAAPVEPATTTESASESKAAVAERAEQQFKEGYAAFESAQKKVALGLFAAAATAMPKEARYRAFYGRVLAEQEHTRRAAEAELQAAIKLDPNNGEYRVLLAELYRDLGLLLRARGEAERAVAADPNNRKARDLLRALKSV
jgi:curved DNA-binding protein CbpA